MQQPSKQKRPPNSLNESEAAVSLSSGQCDCRKKHNRRAVGAARRSNLKPCEGLTVSAKVRYACPLSKSTKKLKDSANRRWRNALRDYPEIASTVLGPVPRTPRQATDPRAVAAMLAIVATPDYRRAVRRLITTPRRAASQWNWKAERAAAKDWLRVLSDCETFRGDVAGEKTPIFTNPHHYAYGSLVVCQLLAGLAFDDVGERFARVLRLTRNAPAHFDSGILLEGERQLAANPIDSKDRAMAVELVAAMAAIPDIGRAAGALIGGGIA